MSDLLSIGASGVRAYQTALNTVGENIANTGVAGYTRRTTGLAEISATSSSINARYVTSGNGVAITGIGRAADMVDMFVAVEQQLHVTQRKAEATDVARDQVGALVGPGVDQHVTGIAGD